MNRIGDIPDIRGPKDHIYLVCQIIIGLILIAHYLEREGECWRGVGVCVLVGIIEELGVMIAFILGMHFVNLKFYGKINVMMRIQYTAYSVYVLNVYFNSKNDCS